MIDKILLAPYYLALKTRHALYDKGILKSSSCEVPSICLGNITVGGTGKTPHTQMILELLKESEEWSGRNLAVLSRGYKRKSKGFQQVKTGGSAAFYGDEPMQIKNRFPDVTVAVDSSRTEGCSFLCHPENLVNSKRAKKCKNKEFKPSDLIVLDDAFQHRKIKAHINIVLVDWNRPINKDRLIPFGQLRDLPERIHKADTIIVTKCPVFMEVWDKVAWAKSLGVYDYSTETCEGHFRDGKKIHVFFTCIQYQNLEAVYPEFGDNRFIYSKKLILFSGIAKDTPLRMYLSDKYSIIKRFSFPDHHKYSNSDIKRIANASKQNATAVVVSTEKDSQRVRDCKKVPENLKTRLFQIPIKVVFLEENERDIFKSTLLSRLREYHSGSAQTPRE